MTREEALAFISEGTRTGKLATVRDDGRPHVVPIWFWVDQDETIVFNTWHTTVKAKNMRRDNRVTLCVDAEEPPYAFAMIEGTVTLEDTHPQMLEYATLIGGRYMGAANAEAFGQRNAVEGELLVRLTITHIVARKNVAG